MNVTQRNSRKIRESTRGREAHERAEAGRSEISDDIEKDINIDVNISNNTSSTVEYRSDITICYFNDESGEKGDPRGNHANYITHGRNGPLNVIKTPGQGALTMATYEERIAALMTRVAELRSTGDPVLIEQADDVERGIVDLERTKLELDVRVLQMQQETELEQFKLQFELETKLMELEVLAGAAGTGTFDERIAAVKTRAAELRSTGDPELIKQAEDIERAVVDLGRTKFEFDFRILQMQQAAELEKVKVQYELESKLRELEFKAYEAPEPPTEEEPPEQEEPAEEPALASARS